MIKYVRNGKEYERKEKSIKYDMTLNVKIESKLLESFKNKCKNNNKSYSEVIRKLMEEYVEDE